ncbi:MAG: hypothetical protein U0787_01750 [Polyangia bacterium]
MGSVPVLLSGQAALAGIVSQVRYTTLFLRTHPSTTALRATWDGLYGKVQAAQNKDATLSDSMEAARVQVAVANTLLDGFVEEHRSTLRMLVRDDLSAPLYQRYYGSPTAAEVRRMSLEPQVKAMTPFVASMKAAAEPALLALAPKLEKLLLRSSDALQAVQEAQRQRDDFEAKERAPLVDLVNGERRSLFGELCKLVSTDSTLAGIEEAAFRRRSTSSQGEDSDLQALRDKLLGLKAEQAALEQGILQAEADERAAEEAQKKRDAAEKELAALEAQKKEVARREAELKAQLKPTSKGGRKKK